MEGVINSVKGEKLFPFTTGENELRVINLLIEINVSMLKDLLNFFFGFFSSHETFVLQKPLNNISLEFKDLITFNKFRFSEDSIFVSI